MWVCTVEGFPSATWFSDVDVTGPAGPGGEPINGVTCRQVTPATALLIGRKVYNILKILRNLPIEL